MNCDEDMTGIVDNQGTNDLSLIMRAPLA